MPTSVEIYQDTADSPEWRWRVTAEGSVIGKSSEGFSSRAYAVENLQSLPGYCREGDIKTAADRPEGARTLPLDFYRDAQGEWRWRIKAQNGRIVHASDEGWTEKHEAVDNLRSLAVAVASWSPQ